MTVLKNLLAGAAALTLVGAPVIASAATPASKLSVSQSARAGSAVRKNNQLAGGFLVPLLAAIAIGVGIAIASGGSKSP